MYKSILIYSGRYETDDQHQERIREALEDLGDKTELYSVQHAVASNGSAIILSTLIVYRDYSE